MIHYRDGVIVAATPEEEVQRVLKAANAESICEQADLLRYLREPEAIPAWVGINPYDGGMFERRSLIWYASEDGLHKALSMLDHQLTNDGY